MALTLGLEMAGFPPRSVKTSARVSMDKVCEGHAITSLGLATDADVPGIEEAAFQAVAEATKKGRPVSKALAAVPITLKAVRAG